VVSPGATDKNANTTLPVSAAKKHHNSKKETESKAIAEPIEAHGPIGKYFA